MIKRKSAAHHGGTFAKPAPARIPAARLAMDEPQLKLTRTTGLDGTQVVCVAGELDIATAEHAYDYLSDVIDHSRTPVSVDLSGLTFCDASGLGVLARTARHAREAHRAVLLTSVRPSLLRIMRITGLDSVFPETAVAAGR